MTTGKRESDFRSHTNFLLLFALFFGLVQSAWADAKENSAAILGLAQTHCFACHSPGDPTAIPGTPRLEGQLAEFLVLQLQNYRIGERPHPVMAPIAKALTDAQVASLSRYYSQQVPRAVREMSDRDNRGKDLFLNGNLQTGVAACAWCHGLEGEGLAPHFPRIASQVPDYTLNQLNVFAKVDDFGNRFAWVMKAAILNLTDEEAMAVAEYLSTLP